MTVNAYYRDSVGIGEGLSPLDKQLLKLAGSGKSPVEMGLAVNLPPEQVLLRVRELLESRDVWSERERFLMYLDDLYKIKDDLQREVALTGDPKAVSNLLRALEQLGKTLLTVAEMNRDTATVVTETQARFLVGLIVESFEYAKRSLAEEYPDLPVELFDAKLREGLALANS